MKQLFVDSALRNVDTGSADWFRRQAQIIRSRPLTKATYDQWYSRLLRDAASCNVGLPVLEIGSGSCYVKGIDGSVITSDVVPGLADVVIDGQSLPFDDSSLRAILLVHVFHHIPDVENFLTEAARVLAPNGVISMIDVAHTTFAQFFFKMMHPEPYLTKAPEWKLHDPQGHMDANQALSWIVFERDRSKFERRYPQLRIERKTLLPWLGYLLSGGVTRRCLVPIRLSGGVARMDRLLRWTHPFCSLHWHITVRKIT